jgi:hypothetical protein
MGRPKKEFPPEPKDHNGKKRVWWNGQWHHLGLISEPEAWRAEFARLIALWSVDPTATPLRPRDYLIVTLFEDYLASADSPAGAKQRDRVGRVAELLAELHGTTPATAFGPKEFRAWQRWLCDLPDPKDPDRTRFNATSVRDFRNVLKAVWKWAAATERLPAERWQALRAVAPPRRDGATHFAKQEAPGETEQNSVPGMASSRLRVRFRVRGWVTVEAVERLRWEQTGQEFEITGAFRDGIDTVIDCSQVQGGGARR